MKIIHLLPMILICFNLLGQRPTEYAPKIKLSGVVIDQETQQPLEYATISLKNQKKPERLQGGITDFEGKFNIEITPGVYDITIEYIGFESFKKEAVTVRSAMDLGKVNLFISSTALEGVEVMAEKTEVEIRLDKRIYNCLLYTSPSPRDGLLSRMPSSA